VANWLKILNLLFSMLTLKLVSLEGGRRGKTHDLINVRSAGRDSHVPALSQLI
jgi:hypothetical protein